MKKQRGFSMGFKRGVIIAAEKDNAVHIAKLMEEYDIGAVVILRGEKLVGLVSERDLARRVIAKGLSPQKVHAKDFMTTKVVTAEFKDGIRKIYQTLCNVKFRHLPIMDKGKLVGIASQRDVLYSLSPKEMF
ncbi:CBS domain-containing protein [Candidatus Omnitrophota bacterium]